MTTTESLTRLLQSYARGVDERDLGLLASLFHPDAIVVGARGTMSGVEWLETMRAPRSFPVSMHMIGIPMVSHVGSEADATMDTYAVIYQLGDSKDGSGDMTMGIRYRDEVVLVEGRWLFKHRESQTLWMR